MKISPKHARHGQQGYALLMVVFLIAMMAIAVTVVAPNIITNTKREREEEMIWRGRQYVRGIRLFYGKNHRFPTELEDLYKPKTGIRFLRQAYKDPMNVKDGSWRLIYVGPNGMLIGSLKNRTVNMAGQAMGGFGGPTNGAGSTMQGTSSMFGSANGFGSASSFGSSNNSSFGSSGPNAPSTPGAANNTNAPATTDSSNPSSTSANGQPTPDPIGDGDPALQPASLSDSPVMGGNIIGVGSKVNQRSIIWFEKAKNYRQFEFVWDPSVDALTGARPGMNTNTGGNPFGNPGGTNNNSPFSNGTNPNPNPNPPQNPGLNPDPNGNPPLQVPPNQ
jgi:hypothetical protein